jgi:hypothetical protein
MLEPFEEKLGELLETARSAPALSEGWQARAMARMVAVAGKADRKETRPMRRLAYAMAFLLVIGLAAAGVFTRSRRPDGKALLISAAQAMEAASSVHVVGHGTAADKTSPSGMKLMPETAEMWYSANTRRVAMRMAIDGKLVDVLLIDLDAGVERYYFAEEDSWYEADLTPVASQAAVVVAGMAKSGLPNSPIHGVDYLADQQRTVQMETREGREIAVITCTGTNNGGDRPLIERHVFEVDMATKHLLCSTRYAKIEGGEEQVLDTVDHVDYDVPVPTDAPANAPVAAATVRAEESDECRSLVLYADGKEIERSDVPR